ncbi:hypothetical protein [Pediococcus acidilactici]|uniref:hypothetical protein n=1 Tax=Pediococcus acidilactici TaxID=1254 RepID=UPI0011826F58|nr:hypothetical protein [Pediococcus acidilactici]WDA27200.1 hypothetical protein PSQ91_05705 [Pediococcus acidilactici]
MENLYSEYRNSSKTEMNNLLQKSAEKLDGWLLGQDIRKRQNINALEFAQEENVPVRTAVILFNDACSKGMFTAKYRYRNPRSGQVIAFGNSPKEIREKAVDNMIIDDETEEPICFIEELIEKRFYLNEEPKNGFPFYNVSSDEIVPELTKEFLSNEGMTEFCSEGMF